MFGKTSLVVLATLIGLAFAVPDTSPVYAQDVQIAQARKKKGILQRLFGPRDQPKRIIKKKPSSTKKRSTKRTRKSSSRSKSAARAAPAAAVLEKDPNAAKILVVGDYVAVGIDWGLEQALAEETAIAVAERVDGSSGLVRTDRFDWNREILNILNEEGPEVVVIVLGANDRQDIRGEAELPFHSEEWETVYTARIDSLAETLKVYGRPFFWVSAPPIRGDQAMADMSYLNSLIQPRVEKAGGHFVDIWNGFTNASGQFITTGPDTEGQNKALRTRDGINFTSAGKRKLAYYVERDIRRITGLGSGAIDILASVTQSSTIEIGPDGKKRLVGPVLSLSEPPPGPVPDLAGAPLLVTYGPTGLGPVILPDPKPLNVTREDDGPSARHLLVVAGEAPRPEAGRFDDFSWPPSTRVEPTYVSPEEAAAAEALEAEAGVQEDEQPDT